MMKDVIFSFLSTVFLKTICDVYCRVKKKCKSEKNMTFINFGKSCHDFDGIL